MKFIIKHQILFTIALITFLGGLLRFWHLDSMPPSLNWDEVSHGYNAYSILKTGLDEWGVKYPLIFRAFGDYKLPVYIYATVIPVFLFGLNAFAVRFISALAGTLAIPGIYLLMQKVLSSQFSVLSKNSNKLTSEICNLRSKNAALTAAFLLAVSPWHFFISRPALEANLSLTLIIFGFYYLLKFLEKESTILPSAILLGLSLHTYNTARVFVPLLVFATLIIYKAKIKDALLATLKTNKSKFATATGFIVFFLSIILITNQLFSGEATKRYNKLQILSESAVFQIGESRTTSNLPKILSKLIYNRPLYFTKNFTANYFKYFSPQFFFQSRGSQSQFAIPSANLLTIPVYLLSIFGLFISLGQLKSKNIQFLLAWLLLSPVASALTVDPPQALRPNPLIPVLIILSVLALEKLPKIILASILTLIAIYFAIYYQNYFNEYKKSYSSSWQYGYSQIMDFVRFYKNDYTNVFITKRLGEPHIFYAFYNQIDPSKIQPSANNIRFTKSDWYWTDKIDNVYFVNDWQIPTTNATNLRLESGGEISTKNSLLITSPDHVPVNAHVIETINFLDGSPSFIITTIP